METDDDVTLVVDGKEYKFSKKKLSQCSGYFSAMFNSDFAEKNQSVIKLQGVSAAALEHIWRFMTEGRIQLGPSGHVVDETLDLLQAASMFQLIHIQDECVALLLDVLDVDNVIPILDMASRLDFAELIHRARAIALWHFDDVAKQESFCRLSVDQVEGYVSDPALHSWMGEWGVWEAINRWIDSPGEEGECRKEHVGKLIRCLHLDSLSLSDLRGMALYESVKTCPEVAKAIRRIIEERFSAGQENYTNVKEEKRKESDETDKFIEEWQKTEGRQLPYVPSVVGNVHSSPETVSPWILKFSESEKKFIPVMRLNKVESTFGSMVGFKVISSGSNLFVVGGEMMTRESSWNDAVWMYDQIHNSWTFLSNLLSPARHISACCVGDDLYVIGGFGRHRVVQDTVSKLNLRTSLWTTCAPLPRAVYSVPCCVFRNHIYIIESVIYQYIPSRDVWVPLSISPNGKWFANAMANDQFIFLSEAYTRNVYRFDPTDPSARLELLGTFKNECVQACLIDDYIYSLSQDGFGDDMYCEKLNIRTGESVVLWEGTTGGSIVDLNPQHHHGCFPLLLY